MNWKDDSKAGEVLFERVKMLERRIAQLEARLDREKEILLEEDLKARGLK